MITEFSNAWLCYGGRCYDLRAEGGVHALSSHAASTKADLVDLWLVVDHAASIRNLSLSTGIVATSVASADLPRQDPQVWWSFILSSRALLLLMVAALSLLLAAWLGSAPSLLIFGALCVCQMFFHAALAQAHGPGFALHTSLWFNARLVAWSLAIPTCLLGLTAVATSAKMGWRLGLAGFFGLGAILLGQCYAARDGHEALVEVLQLNGLVSAVVPLAVLASHLYREFNKWRTAAAFRSWPDRPLSQDWLYVLSIGLAIELTSLPELVSLFGLVDSAKVYDARSLTLLAMVPLFVVISFHAWILRRKMQSGVSSEALMKAKRDAISDMIQMVAHDTRKPFSLMRTGVALLKRVKSVEEIDQVVATVVTEVERSIRAVNAMLEDIMSVSSEPKLAVDAVFVDAMVSICLHRVFSALPDADVDLAYRFEHKSALHIDSAKILRVLTSLVEHALRATKSKCRMWFHTSEYHEDGRTWVILTVGNSGSFIPANKCAKIFDAYFVEGHASGASLSLAVARTFVELHQGTISCRSQEGVGTEFVLKLPTLGHDLRREAGVSLPFLPTHSRAISAKFGSVASDLSLLPGDELTPRELTAHGEIRQAVQTLARPLRVLLIDDEPIYTAALTALLEQVAEPDDPTVGQILEVVAVSNPTDAMKALAGGAVDLAIVDVDLGSLAFDGLTLIKRYKQQGLMHFVCVHSNRSFPADYKRAIDGGADSFLPKPMSRAHLFEVVLSAATIAKAFKAKDFEQNQAGQRRRPQMIVVVDDDIFVREAWALTLAPKPCQTFADCQAVLTWIQANPAEVKQVGCFVLDLYFEGQADGLKLADDIRALCQVPILLSSDASIDLAQHPAIDAVIPKEPMALESLLLHVERAIRRTN